MPYTVRRDGDRWAIVRKTDGKVVGRSDSKAAAEASVRARMSGEHGGGKDGTRTKRR